MAGASYFCTGKSRGLGEREKIWISFSFGCGTRDVGKGSPPPSPNHNLRNSGESEVANPDFQGYLKAVWTWSLYYFCQSSALDNSIASTLILKFEDFRIKKKEQPKWLAWGWQTQHRSCALLETAPAGGEAKAIP